jgi:hypothetical protein
MANTSTEIANVKFSDIDLAAIKTMADAQKFLESQGVEFAAASEYGSGFAMLENKDMLIGRDFLILDMNFYPGDFEKDFAALQIITTNNEKFILVDGSTGICEQARLIRAQRAEAGVKRPGSGIIVKGGLTRSDFFFNAKTGMSSTKKPEDEGWAPATTYYFAEG